MNAEEFKKLVAHYGTAVNAETQYHTEYQGKVMPESIAEKFVKLRDQIVPSLFVKIVEAYAKQLPANPVAAEHFCLEVMNHDNLRGYDYAMQVLPKAPVLEAVTVMRTGSNGVKFFMEDVRIEHLQSGDRLEILYRIKDEQ